MIASIRKYNDGWFQCAPVSYFFKLAWVVTNPSESAAALSASDLFAKEFVRNPEISSQSLSPTRYGVLLIVTATFLWSLSGFLTQLPQLGIWEKDSRGTAIAFWRALFALVLLIPLCRRVSWHFAMIPMMVSFATMTISFLTAIVVGSPANTIWLQYLAPAWVMLGAILIYGDRPTSRDWLMLSFCTAGVLFILMMETISGEVRPHYRWYATVLAILSGITYAGVILSMRALPKEDPAWLITLNHGATALVVGPIVLLGGMALPSGGAWWVLVCLGIFQMGLPYFLFAHGLKTTPSHIAALISLLEPVLLPIWVHIVRRNDPEYLAPGWWTWVGAGLIMVGLLSRYATLPKALKTKSRKEDSEGKETTVSDEVSS